MKHQRSLDSKKWHSLMHCDRVYIFFLFYVDVLVIPSKLELTERPIEACNGSFLADWQPLCDFVNLIFKIVDVSWDFHSQTNHNFHIFNMCVDNMNDCSTHWFTTWQRFELDSLFLHQIIGHLISYLAALFLMTLTLYLMVKYSIR